jgi:hypothetical protein
MLTIDKLAAVRMPARNRYIDMKLRYRMLMSEAAGFEEGDSTWVYPCNARVGDPLVENVVAIGGFFDSFYGGGRVCETYGGTFDKGDPDAGCWGGMHGACPTPGKFVFVPHPPFPGVIAGSINGDAKVDIADGVFLLNYLFRSGSEPPCLVAADFNGDGAVDASDAVAAIFYVLQPTEEDLDQLPGDYGIPPWPGPALGAGCVQVVPNGLSCENSNPACK